MKPRRLASLVATPLTAAALALSLSLTACSGADDASVDESEADSTEDALTTAQFQRYLPGTFRKATDTRVTLEVRTTSLRTRFTFVLSDPEGGFASGELRLRGWGLQKRAEVVVLDGDASLFPEALYSVTASSAQITLQAPGAVALAFTRTLADGATCGTRGAPGQCGPRSYCFFEERAICGATDMGGRCQLRMDKCTKEYMPVCGCDGKTYGNACMASSSGVSVASRGACSIPDGATCGTRGVPGACADGSFCKFAITAACGATDIGGTCTKKPTICTREYMPVCGCDGKTYGNKCTADAAGASVSATGACPP